jgi:hypothetical protein
MNIQTVASNLRNTIKGKEMLLAKWQKAEWKTPEATNMMQSMVNMLELNIDDLVKILADVEQCIPKNIYSDMDPGRDYLDGPMIKMFRDD